MSVADAATVDAIGIDRLTGDCVLTISDHLGWDDPNHLAMLQEKLNLYLAFVESGEIGETYPNSEGRKLRIDIVLKHEANETGRNFLKRAGQTIADAGFALSWGKIDDTT